MKINGKEIAKQGIEVIVFPRKDGDLVFKARPVNDFENFEKLCPRPLPGKKLIPGGQEVIDVEAPEFKKAMNDWAAQRTNWMLIQSLLATDGLTFDTVNLSDSSTWGNFSKEMAECGLSVIELNKLLEAVTQACGLTQNKIDEATKRFLAGQAAQQKG